jgi:hypothetical protein
LEQPGRTSPKPRADVQETTFVNGIRNASNSAHGRNWIDALGRPEYQLGINRSSILWGFLITQLAIQQPIRMKFNRWQILGIFILGLAFLPRLVTAGIPSGSLQINVTGPTNHIWDASSIHELQHLDFEISDENTEISFDAPFVQTGGGKLIGTGLTQLEVDSPIFVGAITDAIYKASGSVTSSRGVARVTFTGSARGLAVVAGKTRILTGTLAVKVAIDSLLETASGVYTSTGAASGYGSIKEVGTLDLSWTDVVNSMGNGSWALEMQLTNDGVKKIGGTANVTLSSGARFDFTIKGAYKSKTDTSVLILSGFDSSKGSVLKVNLTGSTISGLQGKVSGQAIKWKP